MKPRPKLAVTASTKWVGRRGGSWYNMGVVNPTLSDGYQTNRGDNNLGFRTVLNHRVVRAAPRVGP